MSDELNVDEQDVEPVDTTAIAQILSELSQANVLPEGFADAPKGAASFTPAEIDFGSNDWIARLCRVQLWLALDTPLTVESKPIDIATSLFRQITWRQHSDCFEPTSGESIQLTSIGAQALEERLTRAAELKGEFESALEDKTLKEASDGWREAWEEAGSEAREPFGSINAKVEPWKIKTFKSNAEDRLLDLNPSYQRDVVWSNVESQKLIESVLRGIPLPSVILTRRENSKVWQIVDGKQRLTAILRFMGHHPDARARAKGMEGGLDLFDNDFRAFARKNNLKGKVLADMLMPYKLDSNFDPSDGLYKLRGKYYYQIKNEMLTVGLDKISISDLFESEASDYLIPVIQYKDTKLQDIHRVFSLYNKQGRKLNAEELRNAGYHHLDLTRLLLVMSGDRSDEAARRTLTDYVPVEISDRFPELGQILADCGFGTARFKRTKVLSWATAIMLHGRKIDEDGKMSTPSTATQIDDMLKAIGEAHPLHKRSTLIALARTWVDALTAHADASAAWSTKFRKRRGGTNWEELPLVASLIATCLLVEAGATEKLTSQLEVVREVCEKTVPPTKTQNKTQWEFIAKFSVTLLSALQIDEAAVGKALEQRYGYNCLPTFHLLAG